MQPPFSTFGYHRVFSAKNHNKCDIIQKKLKLNYYACSSKDIKKDIEQTIRFKMDNIVNQLNLVSREEFEVQKKLIEKLQKSISKYNKKIKKTKQVKKP